MPSNEEMARHLLACYDTIYMVLGESAPTLSADAYVVRTYEMGRSFGALALEMRSTPWPWWSVHGCWSRCSTLERT